MMDNSAVFQRLTEVAKRNKFRSAAGMFLDLKYSKTILYMIRDNEQKLSDKIAADICKTFNVNIEWLIKGEGEYEKVYANGAIIKDYSSCAKCAEKDATIKELRVFNQFLLSNKEALEKEIQELKDKLSNK